MSTAATAAAGTLLKIDDGAGNYTTIAEVMKIEGLDLKQDTKEATSHSSPGFFKERIGTLLDGGSIKAEVNFLPQNATQSYSGGVLRDMVNRTRRNFKIVFTDPGATTWIAPCYVTGFKPSADVA